MDILTLLILIASLISGGAASASWVVSRKKKKRRYLHALHAQTIRIDGKNISIFAVFWDLGVSDYALEIMAAQRILPQAIEDIPANLHQLEHLIQNYASYSEFLQDMLDAIQEFYDSHRDAGIRRNIPALKSTDRKSIKIAAVGSSKALVPYHDPRLFLDRDLDGRAAARSGDIPLLAFGSDGDVIDLDQVGSVGPLDFLEGLFYGSFGTQLSRWFQMRELRSLKSKLDHELADIYFYFVTQSRENENFINYIYDISTRWKNEAERIEALALARPWKIKAWSTTADLLVDYSKNEANTLSSSARNNVKFTLDKIAHTAKLGNLSLAGYLVYLNHHAFFAGRAPAYGECVRRIESAAYYVQQEIKSLQSKKII